MNQIVENCIESINHSNVYVRKCGKNDKKLLIISDYCGFWTRVKESPRVRRRSSGNSFDSSPKNRRNDITVCLA